MLVRQAAGSGQRAAAGSSRQQQAAQQTAGLVRLAGKLYNRRQATKNVPDRTHAACSGAFLRSREAEGRAMTGWRLAAMSRQERCGWRIIWGEEAESEEPG